VTEIAGTLAERLSHLRATKLGRGGSMLTFAEIAADVRETTGQVVREDYIRRLFSGELGRRPPRQRLEAILGVFGETLDYLDDVTVTFDEKLRQLRAARLRADGAMLTFAEVADHVRTKTGQAVSEDYIRRVFAGELGRKPPRDKLEAILGAFDETLDYLEDRGDPNGTFAQKMKHLLFTYRQPDRRMFTREQIATYVRETTGRSCDAAWISALINDHDESLNPAADKLQAIAGFFGVSPVFFFSDSASRAVQAESEFVRALGELQAVGGTIAATRILTEEFDPADLPKLTAGIRAAIKAIVEHGEQEQGV